MDNISYKELCDALETARIIAGAKFEELCNDKKYKEAAFFALLRDSLREQCRAVMDYTLL